MKAIFFFRGATSPLFPPMKWPGSASCNRRKAAALRGRPPLLLLEEPSLGLAPLIVKQIFAAIGELNEQGLTVFLVEQSAYHALKLAHRGYVMVNGRITMRGR